MTEGVLARKFLDYYSSSPLPAARNGSIGLRKSTTTEELEQND
jgi:hypothetical protein